VAALSMASFSMVLTLLGEPGGRPLPLFPVFSPILFMSESFIGDVLVGPGNGFIRQPVHV
jgi:hypothetical protein